MAKKKKQNWTVGDVFLVKTNDGKSVIGQIVAQEQHVLNCVSCAFFDWRISEEPEIMGLQTLPLKKMFSILFVTRDLLDNGVWRIVGHLPVIVPKELFPYENLRQGGFVGAKVIGSGIINEFLNAYYALTPWDDWKDPEYLDKLLLSPDKKPDNLKYKG